MSLQDFWFRWLPAKWLSRTRMLSLEGRGAYADYISIMHEGDGTLPDERSDEGLKWHVQMLGVRDGRTVKRVLGELLKHGKLKRRADGRLVNDKVESDRAARKKSGGGPGSGQGGDARQLSLVVDNGVDELGKSGGQPPKSGISRPTDGHQSPDSRPSRRELPNEINGRPDSVEKRRIDHEVVAVPSPVAARARGDPTTARA